MSYLDPLTYRSARDAEAFSLPRVFEVYVIRVATAAHNVAHFSEDCNFDEALFSDRMKVGLYNTKRNVEKRAKAVDKPCTATAPPDAGEPVMESASRPPAGNLPAPAEPGNAAQESVAADIVAHCLQAATRGGSSFACNVRLIRSAVHRRDPQGINRPLQNALKSLLNGVRSNDAHATEEAINVLKKDATLGSNM